MPTTLRRHPSTIPEKVRRFLLPGSGLNPEIDGGRSLENKIGTCFYDNDTYQTPTEVTKTSKDRVNLLFFGIGVRFHDSKTPDYPNGATQIASEPNARSAVE